MVYVKGIDVSHHQVDTQVKAGSTAEREVDLVLAAAMEAGARFVVLKATEGTHYADPTAELWARSAHALGLRVGAYHFARPDRNLAAQEADWFWWWTANLELGPDLVVCDVESALPDGNDTPSALEWVDRWCGRATKHFGDVPFVYSYLRFWSKATWTALSTRWPLWVARDSDLPPDVPWTIWQYGQEQLAGRPVDVDVWRFR